MSALDVNSAYNSYRANPSPETEADLYSSIIQYTKRYCSAQYGGKNGYFDTYQEATSIVPLKVWENLEKYNPERSKFSSWVTTIIRNTCIDLDREYSHRNGSLFHDDIEDPKGWDSKQTLSIQLLTKGLSKEDSTLLWLKLEGFSSSEIAEKMGLTVDAIKSRWKRIKETLKAKMSVT